MSLRSRALLLAGLLPLTSLAADPATPKAAAKKPKAKSSALAPKIEMPSFGELPKSDGLVKNKEQESLGTRPKPTGGDASYSVVAVEHARAFVGHGPALKPVGGSLEEVVVSGKPPTTEKFSTLVRVRCAQRTSARLELALLDPRGDTAMSATGQLTFREGSNDLAEYLVDWDPSPVRSGGTYQLLVRVAGQALGTFPLKLGQPKP